jgi:hypothetical protein
LSNVIPKAKHNNYSNQILRSNNKIKTAWDIVKVESGRIIDKNKNINIKETNMAEDY